jgi:hypothetical protein
MASRRSVYDPLDATGEPRWFTVRSRGGGALRESRLLDSAVNLRRVFVAAMLERIDAGWEVGEFSSRTGVFFCTRGTEREMVGIVPCDPSEYRRVGAAHLASGANATTMRIK